MAKEVNAPANTSLTEVVDRILDKDIMIDAWVKVRLLRITLLSIQAFFVIVSVATYLKYAEDIGLTAASPCY